MFLNDWLETGGSRVGRRSMKLNPTTVAVQTICYKLCFTIDKKHRNYDLFLYVKTEEISVGVLGLYF